MKKILSIVAAFALLFAVTGCSSLGNSTVTAQKIQNLLTNILPPGFSGDYTFDHGNPYFRIEIKVIGIHRTPDEKWSWTGLEYDRSDFFNTGGKIKMTPSAK